MEEKNLIPEYSNEVKETFTPDKETYTVVDIRFREGGKNYFFDPGTLELHTGDHVIIDTSRGPEFGTCSSGNHVVPAGELVSSLRSVLRIATERDCRIAAENREKEKKAYSVCQEKIRESGLDMQLVSAEWAFDGSKILFFFTADGRVDFRDLVKSLASVFRTRIELRQIGVRDKAKMVGGLGVCGRPFCCREFLPDFQPVSIKMAKTQSLSLNPTKISGTCGRLMCCLKYEQDAYEDLIKNAPKAESFVDTPDGRGTITEVCLLKQAVKVRMEKDPDTVNSYRNDAIYVLRSGKAKKNDAPIPEDFAPLSSSAAVAKREQEAKPVLEPVVLKSEAIQNVPENPAESAATTAEGEEQGRRKRNRRRGGKGENRAPEQASAAAEKKPEAVEATAEPAVSNESKKRHRRRHGGKSQGDADNAQQKAEPAAGKENAPEQKKNNNQKKPSEKNNPTHSNNGDASAAPAAEGSASGEKSGKSGRRRYYRNRNKKSGGNGGAQA